MSGRGGWRLISCGFLFEGEDDWQQQGGDLVCKIAYLRGGEAVIAGRIEGQNTVVIRARASAVPQVTTHWRIEDKVTQEIYLIKSALPSDRGRYIDFTCQSEAT
ncbi:head-tail adaptor protein [Leisingera sp. M658]|uniref:head-tail adaptor protein n=1 Tax=Leisingera sp. M658 TaxID=2867015 RepID=UPI0021A62EA7|nr:head-tail adaptor protein [Leisingera sp. M658]UWQ77358.1 head-tail adaptor protein [Leisingera sp. M658]